MKCIRNILKFLLDFMLLYLCALSTVGVGCTQQHCDNWITHQEDFNSILSALNKDANTQSCTATFSLSDKSKNSRNRVQYVSFLGMDGY